MVRKNSSYQIITTKCVLVFFLFVGIVFQSLGQCVFHKLHRPNETGNDYGNFVLPINDGYLITGTSEPDGSNRKCHLVKLDLCGDTTWYRNYNLATTGSENAISILEVNDSTYCLYGYHYDTTEAASDTYFLWTNENGDSLNYKSIDVGFNDKAVAHCKTQDGGFIITGYIYDTSFNTSQIFIAKTDAAGNLEWQKFHGGPYYDFVRSLDPTSDGGYVLSGRFENEGPGKWDWYLLKVDSLGNQEWREEYGDTLDQSKGYSFITQDKGFVMVGYTELTNGVGEAYIIKTDSLGQMEWENTFGYENYFDTFLHGQQLSSGDYIISGGIMDLNSLTPNAWLMKINQQGDSIWSKEFSYYGGDSHTYVEDLKVLGDSGFIMTGYIIDSQLPAKNDIWVIRTDEYGNVCELDTSDSDGCSGVLSSINSEYIEESIEFIKIYPNPTSGSFTIKLNTKGPNNMVIVYNQLGVKVQELSIEEKLTTVEARDLPSGIYFIQVRKDNEILWSEKIVVTK